MSEDLLSFQASRWSELCITLAAEAARGCGASHDLYVTRFSQAVDEKVDTLPEHIRSKAIEEAKRWDYATPEERQMAQDESMQMGWCKHGIDLQSCPAGCGDL